ncbi:unnamed protein product [Brachionus calyciflorus]|uniref:Secreted protein n=1 Tax=Brachionus calyciflorus TaxID=104777 RepID=A0A813ZP24_9BILA|nr:unnamed protein product [Brachionus calyciflorus]
MFKKKITFLIAFCLLRPFLFENNNNNPEFLLNLDLENITSIIPNCEKDDSFKPYRIYQYDLTVIRLIKTLNRVLNYPDVFEEYHHIHSIRSVFVNVKNGINWRFNANLVHSNCSNLNYGKTFNSVDYDLKCGIVQDLNCKIKAVIEPGSNDPYIDQYQCINYEKNSASDS